MSSIQDERKHL